MMHDRRGQLPANLDTLLRTASRDAACRESLADLLNTNREVPSIGVITLTDSQIPLVSLRAR